MKFKFYFFPKCLFSYQNLIIHVIKVETSRQHRRNMKCPFQELKTRMNFCIQTDMEQLKNGFANYIQTNANKILIYICCKISLVPKSKIKLPRIKLPIALFIVFVRVVQGDIRQVMFYARPGLFYITVVFRQKWS